MLLFLMGVGFDLPTIGLLVLLLLVFGGLIFWLAKKALRKILKESSEEKIKLLSGVSAFVLSPVIVTGLFALIIYISIQNAPIESPEEIEGNYYKMVEEEINEGLKAGMSKTAVVELLGEADTTQSILVYDLSLLEAKEKYVLEINFDPTGLKDFRRQP